MDSLTTIATYQAEINDSQFQTAAERIIATGRKVGDTLDGVSEKATKVGASATVSASSFDRMLARLDPLVAQALKYQATLDQINRAQDAGTTSAAQHGILMDSLAAKYANLTGATETHTTSLGKFGGALGLVTQGLSLFGIGLGVEQLVRFGESLLEGTAHLENQAKVLGISTDALQAFQAAAVLSGAGSDVGNTAIERFTKNIGVANAAIGPARDAFVALFGSATAAQDALQGGAEHALPLAAARLLDIRDASERARIEFALFGRGGQELEAVLGKLADPNIVASMKAQGLVIDESIIEKAHKAETAWSTAWLSFKDHAVVAIDAVSKYLAEKTVPGTGWLGDIGTAYGDSVARMWNHMTGGEQSQLPNSPLASAQFPSVVPVTPKVTAAATPWDPKAQKDDLDKYIDGLRTALDIEISATGQSQQQLTLAKAAHDVIADNTLSAKERLAVDNALVAGANAQLKDEAAKAKTTETYVTSLQQARQVLGDTQADQIAALVVEKDMADARNAGIAAVQTVRDLIGAPGGLYEWNDKLLNNLQKQSLVHADIIKQQIEQKNNSDIAQLNAAAAGDAAIDRLKEQIRLAGLSRNEREAEATVIRDISGKTIALTDQQQQDVAALQDTLQATKEWRAVVDDVDKGFQGMFENFLETGSLKISSLWTSIRNGFAHLIADMATRALETPVIIPMVQGIAGSLGLNASGLGGGASSAGGLGSFSGLGSALGNGLGSIGLGGVANSLGIGDAAWGFPDSVAITPQVGSGIFGTGASLGSLLGPAALGFGIGSFTGSLTGGGNGGIASGIGGALGGALGSFGGPIGTLIGSAIGGALGGLIDGKPSNFTGFANFGSDYSLAGGAAGDKPNATTVGLAQQAGSAISQAAKQLEAAGISLTAGVQRLEIGQRDQSRLVLANGNRVNVGPTGDAQGAITGSLDYLLGGASSTDPVTEKILQHYKTLGELSSTYADQIIADINSVKSVMNVTADAPQLTQSEQILKSINDQFGAAIDKLNSLGIDSTDLVARQQKAITDLVTGFNSATSTAIEQMTDPVLASWNALIDAQKARTAEAAALGADTTLLQRRDALEQEQLLTQLNDLQRNALISEIGLANNLATALAVATANANSAVTAQITSTTQFQQTMLQAAQSYAAAATTLKTASAGLNVGALSPLNPTGQYQASQTAYQTALTAAQTGDVSALNAFPAAAQAFLQQSKTYNASTTAYATDFTMVQKALDSLAGNASAASTVATASANVAGQQLGVLNAIQAELGKPSPDSVYLQTQIDALNRINGTAQGLQTILSGGFGNLVDAQAAAADLLNAISAATANVGLISGSGFSGLFTAFQQSVNSFLQARQTINVSITNVIDAAALAAAAPVASTVTTSTTPAQTAPSAPPGVAISSAFGSQLVNSISSDIALILQTTSKSSGQAKLNSTLSSVSGTLNSIFADQNVTPGENSQLADAIAQLADIINTSNGSTAASITDLRNVVAQLQRYLQAA